MKQWWQGLPKWGKWTLGVLGVLVVIALISPASEEDQATNTAEDSSAPASAGAGEPQADDGDAGCGNVASSDCTPHVGPNGQVRVDALIWSLESEYRGVAGRSGVRPRRDGRRSLRGREASSAL